ncbi:MAG: ABC transporter ATP-binding protein [Gemmatimonadota bacterium]
MRELRTLVPYFKRYSRVYAAGLLAVIGSNFLTTLTPKFLQQGIDALAAPDPLSGLNRAALLLVSAALAGGVLRYIMRQALNSASRKVEYDLRNDFFAHLLSLPAGFYDRTPTGDLMARATNDLLSVRMVAGPAIMYVVDTITRALIIIPAMMAVSPRLALLALAPLLALPAAEAFLGRRIHERSLAIQDHFGRLTDFVRENVSGIRIVRAYNQETREITAFTRLSQEYLDRNQNLARVQAALDPLLMLLGGLSSVIVLFAGGRLVIAGTVSRGEFVAFFVYLALLVWPLVFLGWAYNLTLRGRAAMSRINAIWRVAPSIQDPPAPRALPASTGARSVTFEDVWFRYPSTPEGSWVLQGITFHVEAGTTIGVVGQTGAGKSALVELIVRTYDPDKGRVLVDGLDVRDLRLRALRETVGFVPQETFLFSETLRENVLLGAADDGRLERVAETSQLAAAIPDLPNGYDTLLGERGINLSGGQKQRAAIARALAQDPAVIVLDDALSAVDSHTEALILERLQGALVGKTCLIVSHRAAAVRTAAEIVVLDGGRIVERGTYSALLAANGRFAELVRLQLLQEEIEGASEPKELAEG